ncbi:MAG: hypothetical protein ACXWAC_17860, partial [Usitatibacter sp.]
MSRAQILILALLVLHLLLGALCIVISRGEHKSSALRWWGWGLLTYATGLLVAMTFLLGVPRPIAFTVGIGIVTFAPVLCAHGVLAHTPFRLDAAWVGIGVLVVLVLLVGANFLGYRTALVNLTAPTLLAIVLFTIAARSIVTRGPRDARAANQFLGAILALGVVTWVARFFTLIAALDGTNDIERLDLIVSLFSVAQMVNGVAATLSLVWIDVRLMQAELSRVAH